MSAPDAVPEPSRGPPRSPEIARGERSGVLVAISVVGALLACSVPTEDPLEGVEDIVDGTPLGGVFEDDTTITPSDDGPYIVASMIEVSAGATLSVEAGTELVFYDRTTWPDTTAGILVRGALHMIGTATDSIVLRSASEFPEAGDWEGVLADSAGASVVMSFVRISDARRGLDARGVDSVVVDSSTFEDCSDCGVRVVAGHALVRGTDFLRNEIGVCSDLSSVRVEGGSFLSSEVAGFWGHGGADTVVGATFQDVFADGLILDETRGTLVRDCRILAGRHGIRMRNAPYDVVADSNLIRDVGVGVQAIGARGSALRYNTIRNAQIYAVECHDTDLWIESNTLDSSGVAVGVRSGATPTLVDNVIVGNSGYGVRVDDGSPVVLRNHIAGNAAFGMWLPEHASIVVADSNWWGAASGPYQDFYNPAGGGDAVTRSVDFTPWLAVPPDSL